MLSPWPTPEPPDFVLWAGWRMASTAMRLVIIAACAGAFYVLIGGFHSKFPLPLSFFETQGYTRPAPDSPVALRSLRPEIEEFHFHRSGCLPWMNRA
jgi:hypothetical protein